MPGFEVGDHHLWVGTNLFWETSQKLMHEELITQQAQNCA